MKIKVNDTYGRANLAEWLEARLERALKHRPYEIVVQVFYWICVAIVAALIVREALR